MRLTVRISEWELEESRRILSVGDEERFWLTFEESEPGASVSELVGVVHGVAVPLPDWSGAEFGRHPIRIDVEGGALYWDAPTPATGSIEVAGTIRTNNIDAPDGFPETSGVVRRVRMVWDDFAVGPDEVWQRIGEGHRYEEVASSYLPEDEPDAPDPEVEKRRLRLARKAYDRARAAGRLGPGESFGLMVDASDRATLAGTLKARWIGVVVDLETAATDPS